MGPPMARWCWRLVAFLVLSPSPALADSPADSLSWDPNWPKFRPIEYVATGAVGTAAIAMYWILPPQQEPHWIGGILFDDPVRNALRLRSASALQTVWTLSDALDLTLVAMVFGVDSLAVPILRGSAGTAAQLGLMDAEAYAYSSIVAIGLYDSVGRARPSYEDCQRDPSFAGCSISPTASFPSGHTNEAFTAAGASCANHASLPLYGSKTWDALACARDLVFAAGDGMLRIIGDRHYATDVLAGAGIGFGFGYGVPTLLHSAAPRVPSVAVVPMACDCKGLVLAGTF